VSEAELNKICEEASAVAVKNTSSKTGANIAELFDTVVSEVTDRFQGASDRPAQYTLMLPRPVTLSRWPDIALPQRMARAKSHHNH
jgi:hypothetical protein